MGCLHQTSPLKAQGAMLKQSQKDYQSQREQTTARKQCSSDIAGPMPTRTHADCDSMHRTCTLEAGQKKLSTKKKVGTNPSLQLRSHLEMRVSGKEKPSFPQWSSIEDVRVLIRMLEYSRSGVTGQQKTDSMRFFAGLLCFEFWCLSF